MRTLLVVLALATGASAQGLDPDTQAARRHFEEARALYEAGRYDDAIAEFEIARKLKPLPDFDFNIARTHERREAWGPAADAYERYLAARPDAPDAAALRERIQVLRARVAKPAPPPPAIVAPSPPPAVRPLRGAAIGVGVTALALGVIGAALLGSAASDYGRLEGDCAVRQCWPRDWAGPQSRADASYALFGVAGALAVGDIVLWVLDARRPRPVLEARF
jgi:tetratricopeptide (TPR) repeat protein